MPDLRALRRSAVVAVAVGAAAILALPSAASGGTPYGQGNVLAGVGQGKIKEFTPAGVLVQTLQSPSFSNETTGMCFDAGGNLLATMFSANTVTRFDNAGNVLQQPFGGGYNLHPESCVYDAAGNVYVGQADGTMDVLKFSPTGTPLGAFNVATTARGSDWIDLAADQCTLFYTSENTEIKRFDVCANVQLPDFANGLPRPCFALRIRPNGEVLVACFSGVFRLTPGGAVMQSYTPPGTGNLFALNLDPDNTSFWTANLFTGQVSKVDIATGAVLQSWNSNDFTTTAGLTVVGEIQVARSNISIDDVTQPEGNAGTTPFTFTVSRSNGVSTASVDYTVVHDTTDSADLTLTSGTVTFGPGETSKQVTVDVIGDNVPEPDERFEVRLSDAVGGTITDGTGVGTIVNDDVVLVSIGDTIVAEGDTGLSPPTPATVEVTLNQASDVPVTVDYTTADGSATSPADYVGESGTVTFAPGETQQDVVIDVVGDTVNEPDEQFSVVLSDATNSSIDDGTGVVTVVDDDRDGTFSCRATALRVGSSEPLIGVANPPGDPCRDDSHGLLRVNATAGSAKASAFVLEQRTNLTPDDQRTDPQAGDNADAQSRVADAVITLGLTKIQVESAFARSTATCPGNRQPPVFSSESTTGRVLINGILRASVRVNHLDIPLLGGTLHLNHTIQGKDFRTQRAVWFESSSSLPDVVVGEAKSDFHGNPCNN